MEVKLTPTQMINYSLQSRTINNPEVEPKNIDFKTDYQETT